MEGNDEGSMMNDELANSFFHSSFIVHTSSFFSGQLECTRGTTSNDVVLIGNFR
jgi:hypothetical protein